MAGRSLGDARAGQAVPRGHARAAGGDDSGRQGIQRHAQPDGRRADGLHALDRDHDGRPIVAADLPSIREVLHHEVDALLVPPGDHEAMAAAVERLLADPALAARLATAALAAVPAYSWDRRAERLEMFLASMGVASR